MQIKLCKNKILIACICLVTSINSPISQELVVIRGNLIQSTQGLNDIAQKAENAISQGRSLVDSDQQHVLAHRQALERLIEIDLQPVMAREFVRTTAAAASALIVQSIGDNMEAQLQASLEHLSSQSQAEAQAKIEQDHGRIQTYVRTHYPQPTPEQETRAMVIQAHTMLKHATDHAKDKAERSLTQAIASIRAQYAQDHAQVQTEIGQITYIEQDLIGNARAAIARARAVLERAVRTNPIPEPALDRGAGDTDTHMPPLVPPTDANPIPPSLIQ